MKSACLAAALVAGSVIATPAAAALYEVDLVSSDPGAVYAPPLFAAGEVITEVRAAVSYSISGSLSIANIGSDPLNLRLTLRARPETLFGSFAPVARTLDRTLDAGVASFSVGQGAGREFRIVDAAGLARFANPFYLPFSVGPVALETEILSGTAGTQQVRYTSSISYRFNIFTSAVPEPASWAMMLAGFGLAGSALRRRPASAAATA